MLIKETESRENDVNLLNSYLERVDIKDSIKEKIRKEIAIVKSGIRGERETGYFLNEYAKSEDWIVINDLRLEFDGEVAQIDHILISRLMDIIVLETKRVSEGMAINSMGEFSVFYKNKPYGIASPLEQNRRHLKILKKAITKFVDLPTLLGIKIQPKYFSYIVVSKNCRISRPLNKIKDLDLIVKSDQLESRINADINKTISIFTKILDDKKLEEIGAQILLLDRPIKFDWEKKFGINK